MKTAMALSPITCVYCRVCGDVFQQPRGLALADSFQMKSWQLNHLLRGRGCPTCKGEVPQWIQELADDDRARIDYGFTVQWTSSIRKGVIGGQIPYSTFPTPEIPPLFSWCEPAMEARLEEFSPAVLEGVRALVGGADALRVHPLAADSDDVARRYGVWHAISDDVACEDADTSSIRHTNIWIVKSLFMNDCEIVHGCCWILVGLDIDNRLTINESVLKRLVKIEQALMTYRVLTPEIIQAIEAG
jgi:hypothetical protein